MNEEIFEAVNANAARAKAAGVGDDRQVLEERRQKRRHRRADFGLALRLLSFFVLFWALLRLVAAGAMVIEVAAGLMMLWVAYVSFYAGIWWQYRFGRGWGVVW